MAKRFLLYGATGYTGKLIAENASAWQVEPILAGRNPEKVKAIAKRTGFDYRVFSLDERKKLDNALQKVDVVVHAAGPFSATAVPMVNACLRTKTHYLDITGEIDVFENLAKRDEEAKAAGIMTLPGVGFDVVPSDCLAAHVAGRLPDAHKLVLAIATGNSASRGTLKTMVEGLHMGSRIRKNGEIQVIDGRSADFDFGKGPRPGLAVSWGDVSTAYYSTGIENIEVYFKASAQLKNMSSFTRYMGWLLKSSPVQSFLKSMIDRKPAGPTAAERESRQTILLGMAEDAQGKKVTSRLVTPEAYKLTYMTTLAIARQVLAGRFKPGFQTPSLAYGADFILKMDGVTREDL